MANQYRYDGAMELGAMRFTRTDRARYAPLLAKYGFALDNVRRQSASILATPDKPASTE